MGLISRQVPFLLGTATGAYSLENVVDIVDLEVTWQRHHWHMDAAQAGGAIPGGEYELCHDDHRAAAASDQTEVYPAVDCGR